MSTLRPEDWDDVDQASLESFPASDPPARGSFHAAPSASTIVELPDEPELKAREAGTHRTRTLRNILMATAAAGGLFLIASRLRRRWV